MGRPIFLIATTTALMTGAGATVTAGNGPRLDGRYPVAATITKSNFAGVQNGTRTTDVYTFTSACRAGACAKVGLVRRGGSAHKNYRSSLTRTPAGTYTGTEGPYAYPCPGTSPKSRATFTARHTITIARASQAGRVTAFTGTSSYRIQHCSIGSFVDYRLRGKLG